MSSSTNSSAPPNVPYYPGAPQFAPPFAYFNMDPRTQNPGAFSQGEGATAGQFPHMAAHPATSLPFMPYINPYLLPTHQGNIAVQNVTQAHPAWFPPPGLQHPWFPHQFGAPPSAPTPALSMSGANPFIPPPLPTSSDTVPRSSYHSVPSFATNGSHTLVPNHNSFGSQSSDTPPNTLVDVNMASANPDEGDVAMRSATTSPPPPTLSNDTANSGASEYMSAFANSDVTPMLPRNVESDRGNTFGTLRSFFSRSRQPKARSSLAPRLDSSRAELVNRTPRIGANREATLFISPDEETGLKALFYPVGWPRPPTKIPANEKGNGYPFRCNTSWDAHQFIQAGRQIGCFFELHRVETTSIIIRTAHRAQFFPQFRAVFPVYRTPEHNEGYSEFLRLLNNLSPRLWAQLEAPLPRSDDGDRGSSLSPLPPHGPTPPPNRSRPDFDNFVKHTLLFAKDHEFNLLNMTDTLIDASALVYRFILFHLGTAPSGIKHRESGEKIEIIMTHAAMCPPLFARFIRNRRNRNSSSKLNLQSFPSNRAHNANLIEIWNWLDDHGVNAGILTIMQPAAMKKMDFIANHSNTYLSSSIVLAQHVLVKSVVHMQQYGIPRNVTAYEGLILPDATFPFLPQTILPLPWPRDYILEHRRRAALGYAIRFTRTPRSPSKTSGLSSRQSNASSSRSNSLGPLSTSPPSSAIIAEASRGSSVISDAAAAMHVEEDNHSSDGSLPPLQPVTETENEESDSSPMDTDV